MRRPLVGVLYQPISATAYTVRYDGHDMGTVDRGLTHWWWDAPGGGQGTHFRSRRAATLELLSLSLPKGVLDLITGDRSQASHGAEP